MKVAFRTVWFQIPIFRGLGGSSMKNCIKLGSLTKIQTGKLDANAATQDGQYSFFTCSKDILRINTYSYECECVLVAGNGDLNVKYFDGKFDAYQRTYIIESLDKEKLLVKYLYYFLNSYVETLRLQSIGGVIKYIKLGNLTEAMIPLPSISEQKKIIDIIEKCNGVINSRVQQLKILRELIESRFIELFGDMFLNSKGWPESRLDSVADIVSGITKGRKVKSVNVTEVPYMAVSNVKDGYIDWTTVKTIEATSQEIEQYRLMPDDVLMTEGGDPDKVGRGAIIKKPLDNCIHQNHIFRVRLDESVILPGFFAEYLQHQRSKRYFLGCAKQTTGIASINMKQLRALPVLVPPLSDQEQFVSFVTKVDKSKLSDLLPWKNYSHYLIA